MVDAFLLVGLPYLAVVTAVLVGYGRARRHRLTWTSRSSQFLEDTRLVWGSGPWHVGILVVLSGHAMALLAPGAWAALLASPGVITGVETIGVGAAVLALVGLAALLWRRVTHGRLQAVTTVPDLVVLALLLLQTAVGLTCAATFSYGSLWSTGTVAPYLWSLITLTPQMALVADLPALVKVHLAGAWLLVLLLPFTRLMHVLAVPVGYLWRSPQRVLWANPRRRRQAAVAAVQAAGRREFLKGGLGLAGAAGLMAIGVLDKTLSFFRGPRPGDAQAESALLEKRLQRLQQTAEERQLELERQRHHMIPIARWAELNENKGVYFIDYAMNPGLAFRGRDGLPLLISAKCTHLGCTVGSERDAQGRILCPCHISYFDVETGQPSAGAPARLPLPHLGWALVDAAGQVRASRQPGAPATGTTDPAVLGACSLYLVRPGASPG
jgi:nitrate reductase gamma subunit